LRLTTSYITQGLKYLKMSTTHREGRWRGRRPRARHGGAKRRSAEGVGSGEGRRSVGVWGHCPQKILKFNRANLFIFPRFQDRDRLIALPSVVFHSFTAYYMFIIDHTVVFRKVNTVKQNNVYHCVLFYCKDTFTMGPQEYCANSLSSPSEISIAFCYFT